MNTAALQQWLPEAKAASDWQALDKTQGGICPLLVCKQVRLAIGAMEDFSVKLGLEEQEELKFMVMVAGHMKMLETRLQNNTDCSKRYRHHSDSPWLDGARAAQKLMRRFECILECYFEASSNDLENIVVETMIRYHRLRAVGEQADKQ